MTKWAKHTTIGKIIEDLTEEQLQQLENQGTLEIANRLQCLYSPNPGVEHGTLWHLPYEIAEEMEGSGCSLENTGAARVDWQKTLESSRKTRRKEE